jgi:hypothetical protein
VPERHRPWYRRATSDCTLVWIVGPRNFLITPSRPPSIIPALLVGLTQALVAWSVIDPCTMITSGLSTKTSRHAATIFGFTSTRIT